MLESTLKFIRCPKCNSNLNVEIYKNSNEIDEGILKCEKCQLKFPIIDKIIYFGAQNFKWKII